MKGFGKRLLALTLCGLLLCLQMVTVFAVPLENCPGDCAHLAAIGTTHYDTLDEAIAAAAEGSTITILTDIAEQTALTIDKSIVLDLGGKTLTGKNGDTEGLLNVSDDFTVQNGTVTTDAGVCVLATDCNLTVDKTAVLAATEEAGALFLISANPVIMQADDTQQEEEPQWVNAQINGQLSAQGDYPTLGIISSDAFCWDVTIGEDASITSEAYNAVEMYGNGKLTVSGGTFQAKEHGIVMDIPDGGAIASAITGGSFTTGKKTVLITATDNATAPEGFITGGTYNQDPAAYIPDFCGVITNSDGTYTVVTSFTVTFQANGGSGTMKPITVDCGKSVKLPKCGFTAPKGKEFAGWKIGSKTYAAGKSYVPKNHVTVTAQWKTHTHSGGSASCEKQPVCKDCNTSYGKPLSHDLQYIDAFAPTCSKPGMNSHEKCTICGKLFVDGVEISARAVTIPAVGHSWEDIEGIPATCLDEGLMAHQRCTDCGALQVNDKAVKKASLVIPAGDHTMETVPAVEATCTSSGTAAHERCSVCGTLFQYGQEIEADALATPAVSHVLSDWTSDETSHWKTCISCGEVFRQKVHTDSDQDGICNDCGYSMTAPQQEAVPTPEKESGFSWLFLIPVVAAVAIAVPLVLKKRK